MFTNYVKSWLARADEDIETIRLLLKEKDASPNPICFHAQQAGEKYLKGYLAYHDLHVRKIHDLEILVKDCENVDKSFAELVPQVKLLNNFYTEARYPDDYMEFSSQDAKEGNEAAKKIRDFVLFPRKWFISWDIFRVCSASAQPKVFPVLTSIT